MPGRASGSTIRKKNPTRVTPSTNAASSSSRGMARRNGRMMMTVSGSAKATCGTMRPHRLPTSPSWRIMRYSGSTATVSGNIRPVANTRYMSSRPAIAVPRKRVRGHGAEQHDADRGAERNERGVQQLAPEDAALENVQVVGQYPRVGQPCGVRRQVLLRTEPAEDQVEDRAEREGDARRGRRRSQ